MTILITGVAKLDEWLINNKKLKVIKCANARGKRETLIGHIRNCIHHHKHGTFTPKELIRANKLLEEYIK